MQEIKIDPQVIELTSKTKEDLLNEIANKLQEGAILSAHLIVIQEGK